MDKKITLTNVNAAALSELFSRSLSVSSVLPFSLSKDNIKSLVSNGSDSFWKNWTSTSKEIYYAAEDFGTIDFLVFHGSFFASSVLKLFPGNNTTMEIYAKDNVGVKITIIGDNGITVNFKCSQLDLVSSNISQAQYDNIFGYKDSIASFDLDKATISQILSLKQINEKSDTPVDYIVFTGTNGGKLVASDPSFNKELGDYVGTDFSAKVKKDILGLFDREPIKIYYCKNDEFEKFIIVSKDATINSISCAILMSEIEELSSEEEDELFNSKGANFADFM